MKENAEYKFSMYNYIAEHKGEVIIFNTLTKKIKKIPVEEFWNDMKVEDYIKQSKKDKIQELMQYGFIVEKNVDERALAEVAHLKKVFSNDNLELTILPTDSCNFSCVYCFENERSNRMDKETAEAIIKYVDRNARYYKTICVNWFGGEPTLEKETVLRIMGAIKEICKRDRVCLVGFMTTNGYELDIDTFRLFLKNEIRFYQITIDGTEQCHNRLRPHKYNTDSFQRINNNLIDISTKMKTGNLAFNIGIRFNVTHSNVDDIRRMLRQYIDIFNNDKRFSIIWQWVRDWGGSRISKELIDSSNEAERACQRLYQEAIEMDVQCVELLSCNSGREFCEANRRNAYVINYNGDVLKCAMAIYNQNQDVVLKNRIGHINNNGIMDIDEHIESLWLKIPEKMERCILCKHYPMCMNSCCPLSSKINDNFRCHAYKRFISEQIVNYASIEGRRKYD